jgi:dTDP-4-dehydrorhamnose reductase
LKILLLGPNGQVGWELQRALAPLGELVIAGRELGNLEQPEQLRGALRQIQPQVIVNAAAYTAVDAAESDRERAHTVNAVAPGVMAEEAAAAHALLIHFSTDYVFDGSGERAWVEADATGPVNVYGETKLKGEELIRRSGCRHLIFRTSWVYASRGKNFLRTMLRLAADKDKLSVVGDQNGAPTGAELIADITAHALRAEAHNPALSGLYHLVADGVTTWHGFARHAIETARQLGQPMRVAADAIAACRTADFPTPARRPQNSRLSTERLRDAFQLTLPPWQVGVERAVRELCSSP